MIPCSWQPLSGCKTLFPSIVVLALVSLGTHASGFSLDGVASSLRHDQTTRLGQAPHDAAAATPRSLLNAAYNTKSASNKGYTSSVGALQQQKPPMVPQCFWDPDGQVCDADDAVNIMYAIEAKPMSAYLWFLLMTYDRETVCGQHTTANACRSDKAHRCVYFDDILNIIGGPPSKSSAGSSSSSSSTGGSSGSSTSSSSSNAKQKATTGTSSSSSSSSSKPETSDAEDSSDYEEAYMSLLSAWASSQFAASGSEYAYDASLLQRQLREALLSEHQLLRELLRQQLSPWQQQQQQLFQVAAGSSSSRAKPTAGAGSSQKPAKESGTAKSSSSSSTTQQQDGSSSSSAPKAKPQILCTGADLLENYIFTRSAYSNPLQAPLALHCPGSKAYELIKCMRLPDSDSCKETPGCVVAPNTASSSSSGGSNSSSMCVSEHVHTLDKAAMRKFTFEVTLAEPSAVGSCDGACWMRQALLCNRTTSSDACSALSFCRSSPSGLCTPRLYTQDNFGSSVQEYMGECVDVDNQKDCERLTLQLVNKGAYADWRMAAKAHWTCPVPSIGGLLGPSSNPKLQHTSHGYIAAAGYQEERAAGMQAAAAATAAAANAAKLVLERGPGMLQQIYFSEGAARETKGR